MSVKKRWLSAAGLVASCAILFVVALSLRHVISPLHWAAFWLMLASVYVAIGIAFGAVRAFPVLGVLFPVFLIAALEGAWTVADYFAARSHTAAVVDAPAGARLQSEIDRYYNPLTQKMEFIPDGIRMLKLPSNYRTPSINTNSLGFRGAEFGVKRPGTFRIVMMGDSGMFGWNAPDDASTISAQLERMLDARFGAQAKIEVLNLGVPSGVSTFHVPTFATYGQELDPDLLVMFLGLNDLGGSNVVAPHSFSTRLKRYLSLYTTGSQVRHLLSENARVLHLLALHLRSYKWLTGLIAPAQKEWVGDKISLSETLIRDHETFRDVYLNNLERIYRLANKLRIPFMTFEQPSVSLGLSLAGNPSAIDVARREEIRRTDPFSWVVGAEKYASVVSRGDALARKYGGRHFGFEDVLRAYGGPIQQGLYVDVPKGALFVTAAHYTAKGGQVLATEMTERLVPVVSGILTKAAETGGTAR